MELKQYLNISAAKIPWMFSTGTEKYFPRKDFVDLSKGKPGGLIPIREKVLTFPRVE